MPDPDPDLFKFQDGPDESLNKRQYFVYRCVASESRRVGVTPIRQPNTAFDMWPGDRYDLRPVRYRFRHGHLGGERNRYQRRSITAIE